MESNTPMMHLIKECKEARNYIEDIRDEYHEGMKAVYDIIIQDKSKLLEQEKQMVIDAWDKSTAATTSADTGEIYYNQKYNQ